MGRPRPRRAALLLATLALAAGACGSETDDGVATLETTDTGAEQVGEQPDEGDSLRETEEAMLAFTQCLRDQGLEVEDAQVGADGGVRLNMPMDEFIERMNRYESRAALDACLPHFVGMAQQFPAFNNVDMGDRLLRYAACMRENGYDMPDPDLSGGFTLGPGDGDDPGPFGSLDTDDPDFKAANEVCQGEFAGALDPSEP